MKRWCAALFLAAALGVPAGARAQVPAGGEFLVNTVTTGTQAWPGVAADKSGAYVVVWHGGGSNPGIYGRRFDAAGSARGAEFRVDVGTTGSSVYPTVAADPQGRFVVLWADSAADGSGYGILGRRFDASGAAVGGEFRVNAYTTEDQTQPSAVMLRGGGFVVVWQSRLGDGDSMAIFGRRFDAQGTPLGQEFIVNSYTPREQAVPQVAADDQGRFVVAWTSFSTAPDRIAARRFGADGQPAGPEFQVNASPGILWKPDVVTSPGGGFVVVWQRIDPSLERSIVGRRFDASGSPLGGELILHPATSSPVLGLHEAAGDSSGNFVVAWQDYDGTGSLGVRARRFDAAGVARGAAFAVNSYTTGSQSAARAASDPSGNLAVAWMDDRFGPGASDIFAQRLGGLQPAALGVGDGAEGVLEVDDTFTLATSWRNVNGAAQTFQGRSSDLVVPPGLVLTLSGDADYGTVGNGAVGPCLGPCFAGDLTGSRPPGHVDLSFLESIVPDTQGQRKRWTLHVGDSFTDVPRTSPFYRHVETLLHHGVTAGCTAAAYCPAGSTTREQMSAFVLVAKEGSGYTPPACVLPLFADVPPSSPFCRWIEELARRGVVTGCGGGNYCPTDSVSREQMAVFVLRTLDPALDPPACVAGSEMFADVPASSAYCRWIEELARRGVVTGCGGGNYCPAAPVTREQMAVFLGVTFGLALYGP